MAPDARRGRKRCRTGIIFCLLLIWASLGAGLVRAASEPIGKAESVQGGVAVEREGYSGPAAVNDPVNLLDKWQTKENSGAELVFVDASRIKIGPNASLEITEYLYKPQEKTREGLISMMSGKARFVVQDLQDFKQKRLRVQTQTAVVGTRGTEYALWVVSPEITRILGISNEVDFCQAKDPTACVTVGPRMMSEIKGDAAPGPPHIASPEAIKEMVKGVEKAGAVAPPPPPPPGPPAMVSDSFDPTASNLPQR